MLSFAPAARRSARGQLIAVFLGLSGSALPFHAAAAEPQVLAASNSEGTVEGIVVGGDGRPLASAKIQLSNAAGKVVAQAQTDVHGVFTITGVAPGSYTVSAAKAGNFNSVEVQVSAGQSSKADLALGSEQLQTVTVTANRFERARNSLSPATGSSQYRFTEKAIEQLPQGENTPFNQVLLQAPGVANDSYGQLHIRGDHNDIQYRLNGIILPDGVSGFGQVFDPRFAKSITLNTGALPAEYGLRTAGVIDIVTKDHLDEGSVDLYGGSHDTLNPSFQLGKTYGNFSAYVTGQFLSSNLGVENPTGSSTAIHDWTQQGKGFGYFSYLLNAQTKLSAILGVTGTRLEIPNNPDQPLNCDFVNQLNHNAACDANAPPTSASVGSASISSRGLNERQYERNQYGILALQGIGASDLTYQLALYDRTSTVQFAPDPLGDLVFNGVAARIKRKASALGLQGDLSYPLADAHTLSVGFSGSTEDDRADNTSTVFRTSTPVAATPPCPAGTTFSGDPANPTAGTCYGGPVSIVDN
ncbi:MAG TPA: TonB-dependent receptor, partial [Nevskia sp.]|nr:TonB-dependent receptor [Nevskia sp.]